MSRWLLHTARGSVPLIGVLGEVLLLPFLPNPSFAVSQLLLLDWVLRIGLCLFYTAYCFGVDN